MHGTARRSAVLILLSPPGASLGRRRRPSTFSFAPVSNGRLRSPRIVIAEYAGFARSFTEIRAADIRAPITAAYDSGRFWPEPLVQINPRFKRGRSVDALIADGILHSTTGALFDIQLYQHQEYAIALAAKGESYVVTTGTGSGKSLAFFIPIVDAVLQAKEVDPDPRTRAIIIYPMNALANSQQEEAGCRWAPPVPAISSGARMGRESALGIAKFQRTCSNTPRPNGGFLEDIQPDKPRGCT